LHFISLTLSKSHLTILQYFKVNWFTKIKYDTFIISKRGSYMLHKIIFTLSLFYFNQLFAISYCNLENLFNENSIKKNLLPLKLKSSQKAIEQYFRSTYFDCKTYKTIIYELETICKAIPSYCEHLWQKRETKIFDLFDEVTKSTYKLIRPSIRFFSIWTNFGRRTCSNSCENFLYRPEKWLLGLRSSESIIVEKNGKYIGAILGIGVKNKKEKKRLIYSIDKDKTFNKETIFRFGKKSFKNTLLKFVMGTFFNEKSKPILISDLEKSSGSFNFLNSQTLIKDIGEFEPIDTNAKKLANVLSRWCTKDGKKISLNLLGSIIETSSKLPKNFSDKNAVIGWLEKVKNIDELNSLSNLKDDEKEKLGKNLMEITKNTPNLTNKEKAIIALELLKKKFPNIARKPASIDFNNEFNKTLSNVLSKELAPSVKNAAAVALANNGFIDDKIRNELSDSLKLPESKKLSDDSFLEPWERTLRASDAMDNAKINHTKDDLENLINNYFKQDDPYGKEAILDRLIELEKKYDELKNNEKLKNEIANKSLNKLLDEIESSEEINMNCPTVIERKNKAESKSL